jgi:hypothetical protein
MVTPSEHTTNSDRSQILRELGEIAKDLEDIYYFTHKLFDNIFKAITPEVDPRYQTHRLEAAYICLELIDLVGRVRRVLKNMQSEGAENVSRK